MPELPEVETIRRDLDPELGGRRIERLVARGARSIRRHGSPAELAGAVVGATVASVGRRGKYLVLHLDRDVALVVHLGMSGQLLLAWPGQAEARHTHVVVGFDTGRELRFVDPRTFGEVFATPATPAGPAGPAGPRAGMPEGVPALAHLGPDPLDGRATWRDLAGRLRARRTQLKALLMDQRFVAGLGNIYSDEILFAARLRFDRSYQSLADAEVRRLHRAMTGVLGAAVAGRGSSLADAQYRDAFGAIGGYQAHHAVYGREGEACRRCRGPIVRVKTAGRSSFFCPRCQS